jgi:oligoendopeptidase F
MTQTPPRWDLSNVYNGLDDPRLHADLQWITAEGAALDAYYQADLLPLTADTDTDVLSARLNTLVDRLNALNLKANTIGAYLHSFISTDSYNKEALRLNSQFDILTLPVDNTVMKIQAWLGKVRPSLAAALTIPGSAREHAFFIQESAEQSQYLMSEAEEVLANELSLSGGRAWEQLQGTVTSQKTAEIELNGEIQHLPMPALINLHGHPDETVRRLAYETEMKAWKTIEEPLAACMNGIKGSVNTLNKHRKREDALHFALDMARIDRQTLAAMMGAMQDAFPMFRRYFRAKAKHFGQEQLSWWNLFAPVGKAERTYTFDEARALILENFAKFTPELKDFSQRAFDNHWIDAEQRKGKRGGAFCMSVPAVKESRVLCNFDSSLDQVMTIAHELGHGFHNHCMFQAGRTELQRRTPMTLAETASIMCETIVFNAIVSQVSEPREELAILETSLIGDSQVIVDIYSRFLFEKEVFERREKAELSAEEFCEIMERAQKATYGDGLDERYLHKYMWTWKPHYYSVGLSFYNFPYAFGLLFGTGLYAIYQQHGEAFISDYKDLLASTGMGNAADLAKRFSIDIRERKFWQDSLKVIEGRVDRYCEL